MHLTSTAKPALSWFCIDATAVDDVDFTAAAALRSLYGILKEQGIRFAFVDVADNVRAELDRYGFTDLLREGAFYDTVRELISPYEAERARAG